MLMDTQSRRFVRTFIPKYSHIYILIEGNFRSKKINKNKRLSDQESNSESIVLETSTVNS